MESKGVFCKPLRLVMVDAEYCYHEVVVKKPSSRAFLILPDQNSSLVVSEPFTGISDLVIQCVVIGDLDLPSFDQPFCWIHG